MSRIKRARPALVVVVVALIAAVAGTALAGSGPDANTAGAAKTAKKALKKAKKALSKAKANSAALAALPSSALVRGYERVSDSSANDSEFLKFATAKCPPGKFPLGGGYSVLGATDEIKIHSNAPTTAVNWHVVASEIDPTVGDWQIFAEAICANVEM